MQNLSQYICSKVWKELIERSSALLFPSFTKETSLNSPFQYFVGSESRAVDRGGNYKKVRKCTRYKIIPACLMWQDVW